MPTPEAGGTDFIRVRDSHFRSIVKAVRWWAPVVGVGKDKSMSLWTPKELGQKAKENAGKDNYNHHMDGGPAEQRWCRSPRQSRYNA